jgi:hypothetical protein
MIVTVISIFHLSSPPLIPNVKCIAWNFDGSNFINFAWNFDGSNFINSFHHNDEWERLRFENGDIIPNVESYFS